MKLSLSNLVAFIRRRDSSDPLAFLGRDMSVAFAGHLVSRALGAVTFLVMTRTLDLEQYGLYTLAYAVFDIALHLSELGLNTGTQRFVSKGLRGQDARATDRVLRSVFTARILMGAVVFGLGFALAPFIAGSVVKQPEMVAYFRIAFVGVFGMHLYTFYQSYFGARLEFGKNAVFICVAPLAIFLAIVITWWRGGLDALACVRIYAVVPLIVCAAAVAILPHGFLKVPFGGLAPLRAVWGFSRWVYLTNILGTVRFRLNSILLARLFTLAQVGLYNYADKLASVVTLITATLITVLVPRASHLVKQEELKGLLRKSYRAVFYLLPALVLVPLVSRRLILILAPEYVEAAPIFSIIFVSVLFSLAALPSSTVLYSVNRAHVETAVEGLALVLTAVGALVLVPRYEGVGAAVAMLIQRAVSASLIMGYVYLRVYRVPEGQLEARHLEGVGFE